MADMTTQAPQTLFDKLYRASFRNQPNPGWTDNNKWRALLKSARRFVLDGEMSAFLGELSTQAFVRDKLSPAAMNKVVDRLRIGARLPSAVTWIEYDLRRCQTRNNELLDYRYDPTESPQYEGWLLMRHPKIETAFQAVIVTHDPNVDHGDGFDMWTFPLGLAWVSDDDSVIPWRQIQFSGKSSPASALSSGILSYDTDRAGYVVSDLIRIPNNVKVIKELIKEWSGVQRRMWALLATINDLPVELTHVRNARGFVAKGAYRKFLDHTTITLTVPVKQYTRIIRQALAIAHRRGGPVREHWRQDWRRPLSKLCDHEWGADEKHMFCTLCEGRKIWVIEHTRGDSSRGFVSHDFKVTHPV